MAIRVICPGCMTTFEVGDQFAGKKGPCPKCGHIIEIPKEKLVVHAPEEFVSGGKTIKGGAATRPIEQKRFAFTGKQVTLSVLGSLAVLGLAFAVGLAQSPILSGIVGLIGVFAIAFPIARFGYMLIRDDDDLEMQLGNQLSKSALFTALVFGGSWVLLELFLAYLGNQGPLALLLLVPIAVVGSFGALIFFDCNFGRALLVYCLFAVPALVGRGLILQPNGWIWAEKVPVAAASERPKPKTPETPEAAASNDENSTPDAENAPDEAAAPQEEAPKKPSLSREAPKPNVNRRR